MHTVRTSLLCAAAWAAMQIPALALDRPEWMDRPGIVMAGSWEEPSFRTGGWAAPITRCRPTCRPNTPANTLPK